MMRTTSQFTPPFETLSDALSRLLRPAIGFAHPDDVVKDPELTLADKRAILASWASDACAVQDEPHLRWLLGSPEPVPLFEVQGAMARLERKAGDAGERRRRSHRAQPSTISKADANRPSA